METGNISELLKKWRKKRGLSLSQLAERVATSPATISRYENGWQRFQLYTLREIAAALNCRLHVDLIPINNHKSRYSDADAIRRLKRLFWDRNINKRDLLKYQEWAIKRILEYGNLEDAKLIIKILGKRKFLQKVMEVKFSSKKTDNFWQNILKKENIVCMRKFSQSKEKNYWPD